MSGSKAGKRAGAVCATSAADLSAPPQAMPRVNCFTPGTLIATPRGETAIEALRPGNLVLTRDNGPQEISWIGERLIDGPLLRLHNRLQPVLIRAGVLGNGLPERDLVVSPNHRVLLTGDHPRLDAAEAEVLVSARHLVGTRGIEQARCEAVTYLHFTCDRHEVVLSNGAWTESFQPSAKALESVSEPARAELLDLFPDLRQAGSRRAEPVRPAGRLHALPGGKI